MSKKKPQKVRRECRFVLLNGGNVFLQRKFSLGRWRYIHCYNEELHEIDRDLNALMKKAEKLLEQRKAVEEYLDKQRKEVEAATRERHGEGTPRRMFILKSKDKPKRLSDFLEPQAQTWRAMFDPKWLKKFNAHIQKRSGGQGGNKKDSNVFERLGMEDDEERSTVYVHEDHGGKQFGAAFEDGELHLNNGGDVQSVINYKAPRQNNQNQKKKRNNSGRGGNNDHD